MKEKLLIEEYSDRYKDEVISLILSIQREEFNIPILKEDQPDLGDIPNFYQSGSGNFWVALCDNQIVGTISLLDIGNNQVALRKMFVKAAYRGIVYNTAKILLLESISWAMQTGITEIYLGTTERFLAAHRFYEKNGFEHISIEELPGNFPIMKVDTRFYKYVLNG